MDIKSIDSKKGHTVIAIANEEGKYQAVCLSRKKGYVQLIWTKSSDSDGEDWASFAAKCGIDVTQRQGKESTDGTMLVTGFNCAGMVFYRLKIPVVKSEEMERIVRLQTESRLPIAGDQLEISYRTGDIQNGQTCVTVAAARRDNLQRFIQNVQSIRPEKIILDCEAIAKTWSKLFATDQKQAVLISIGQRSSQICLIESGKMTNASRFDTGIMDFSDKAGSKEGNVSTERFVQDIRGTIELFGLSSPAQIPLYFLSYGDGSEGDTNSNTALIKEIVQRLISTGLDAKISDFRQPLSKYQLASEDWASVYEHRVPVGLALIALEADKDLDIFGRLYHPAGHDEKKHWLYSLKTASIVTAMMVILTILSFYFLDALNLKYLDRLETKGKINFDNIVEKQKLMTTIAAYRPDILELLSSLSSVEANGIMLNGLDFKRGQTIKIKGTTFNNDSLYKFQENVGKLKDFKDVKISSSSQDEKTRKIEFTISFHYKNFTK
jgi:hypothetical protein